MLIPDEIISFLQTVKTIPYTNFVFVRRQKNLDTLLKLGFTRQDAYQEIILLEPFNYSKGPEGDHDISKSGNVWTFGKHIDENELYIKIRLSDDKQLVCISFHIANHNINYPYNKGGKDE